MLSKVSEHIGSSEIEFETAGVFDQVVGFDSLLFLDPLLLGTTGVAEFEGARDELQRHFRDVIRLLAVSEVPGDRAWRAAWKRMTFREVSGISIGYGRKSGDGNAIGPRLANQLIRSARQIMEYGIRDPDIFEILGLFEDGFGPDRLSDMSISIVYLRVVEYTARICRELGSRNMREFRFHRNTFLLPINPLHPNRPLLMLPRSLLRSLPVATSWDEVSSVAATNAELRSELNALIGPALAKEYSKRDMRNLILSRRENIETVLRAYQAGNPQPYDFAADPKGEVHWLRRGRDFVASNPLGERGTQVTSPGELLEVVHRIVANYKKGIETRGSWHLLYHDGKPLPEDAAQRLFYAIAYEHCVANDLDVTPEADAGTGPVDFKISRGHRARVVVELKLSSNSHLVHGFEVQLPTYQESHGDAPGMLVIVRTTEQDSQSGRVIKLRDEAAKRGEAVPEVVLVNGLPQKSASVRKEVRK